MARIATECPRCGRVELGIDEVTVVVSPWQSVARYVFDCGGCAQQVFKAASGSVVIALSRLGVPVRIVPAEVAERGAADADLPGLSVDDVLDAMLWLRTHDVLAVLAVLAAEPAEVTPH